MIKMNYYLHDGRTVMSTADLLRGAAVSVTRVADTMDKPNDLLKMLNDVFDVVTRDKVADKIEEIGFGLVKMGADLRGEVIDERPKS